MAKIRTVKPELFRHEALFEAEQHYHLPLRLAFIGLFSCCDREGRFRWEPRSLKLDILSYDEINFADVLNALWEAGFIKKYTWQNKYYGHIPSWHLHQAINKHEPASKLPDPDKCVYEIKNSNALSDSQIPILQEDLPDLHMHARAMHEVACAPHVHASLEMEVEVEQEVEREEELEQEVERELEEKVEIQNSGDNPNIVALARQHSCKTADVIEIFNHWKITLQHPQAVFDKKRQRLIQQALQQGYTLEQLCQAISGCAQTPHNLGENEHGQRYDGLHIILRDADQIERFIRNYHNPPRSPPNPADKLLQANVFAAENWLNQKQEKQKKGDFTNEES